MSLFVILAATILFQHSYPVSRADSAVDVLTERILRSANVVSEPIDIFYPATKELDSSTVKVVFTDVGRFIKASATKNTWTPPIGVCGDTLHFVKDELAVLRGDTILILKTPYKSLEGSFGVVRNTKDLRAYMDKVDGKSVWCD